MRASCWHLARWRSFRVTIAAVVCILLLASAPVVGAFRSASLPALLGNMVSDRRRLSRTRLSANGGMGAHEERTAAMMASVAGPQHATGDVAAERLSTEPERGLRPAADNSPGWFGQNSYTEQLTLRQPIAEAMAAEMLDSHRERSNAASIAQMHDGGGSDDPYEEQYASYLRGLWSEVSTAAAVDAGVDPEPLSLETKECVEERFLGMPSNRVDYKEASVDEAAVEAAVERAVEAVAWGIGGQRSSISNFTCDAIAADGERFQDHEQSSPSEVERRMTGNVADRPMAAALTTFAAVAAFGLVSLAGGAAGSYSIWIDGLTDSGFYQAFSLVFLSEIGDKSFFVAALLAAKLSRLISFVGSLSALAVMSIISVVIGQVFHAVPSGFANGIPLDDIAAVVAFAYFGIKILAEAFEAPEDGKSAMDEEFEEAEEAVEGSKTITKATAWEQVASIFALVFAGEFGDRSFLATIALSAAQNPISVGAGAIAAHAIATGIAVVGGAYISKYVSEKVICYIGGTLFLIFAVTTAIGIF